MPARDAAYTVQYLTSPAAFWLVASGLIVQVAVAIMIYAPLITSIGPGTLMVYYTVAVLGLGLIGLHWLRARTSGLIKYGSLLAIVSAVMSITTFWGFFVGSALMASGGAAGVVTIHPKVRKLQWTEIISR